MITENLNYYLEDISEDLIDNLGLLILIKGKQYQINPLKKHCCSYYIGEALTALSDVRHDTLLNLVRENPNNNQMVESSYFHLFEACVWLRGKLRELYGQIASEVIFINFIKEIELFDKNQKEYFLDFDVSFLDDAEITIETFSGTKYSSYGCSDTGHFMLSALLRIRLDLLNIPRVLVSLSEATPHSFSFLFDQSRKPDIRYQIVQTEDSLCAIYGIKDIYSMIVFDVHQMIIHGVAVRKCKNCSKFFIPHSRSDTMYCSRPSPQEESLSCQEYASRKLWYDRLKADELAKLSRNVYTAKQMLVRRNPDIKAYADMFEYFKKERQNWTSALKSGYKTPEDYAEWLYEMKEKKVL